MKLTTYKGYYIPTIQQTHKHIQYMKNNRLGWYNNKDGNKFVAYCKTLIDICTDHKEPQISIKKGNLYITGTTFKYQLSVTTLLVFAQDGKNEYKDYFYQLINNLKNQ